MPEPLRLTSLVLHAIANDPRLVKQVERYKHQLPKLYRLGSISVSDAIEDLQQYNRISLNLRVTFFELRSLLKNPEVFAFETDAKLQHFLSVAPAQNYTKAWVQHRIDKIFFSQSDYPKRLFDYHVDRELSILVEQLRYEAYINHGHKLDQKIILMQRCTQWRNDQAGETSYQQLLDLRKQATCLPEHAILKFALAVRKYFNLTPIERQNKPLILPSRVLKYLNWLSEDGDYSPF